MDNINILEALPHRFPIIMVDKILDIKYGESVIGIKHVSMNEPWIEGHFPGEPIFPGVLLIETMAQIGGFAFYNGKDKSKLKGYLCGVKEAKFIKKVLPGDSIYVEGKVVTKIANLAEVKCSAKVDNTLVAVGVLLYAFD